MPPNVSYSDIRADDLRSVAQGRRSFWFSLLFLAAMVILVGVAVFMGWIAYLEPLIPSQFWPALQTVLALTPAVIWLVIFSLWEYKSDALRRTTFLLWLVTAALYLVTVSPLLVHVFQINEWLDLSWWSELAGRMLIIAPLEMFLIYLALRYGVYPSAVLQTRTDGPIFGVAAALGVATMVNLLTSRTPGFSSLGQGLLFVSETALGYAVLGAWLGYFLGQARFKRTNTFYLAAGFLLTIILHALFFFSLGFLNARNLFLPSLDGLILAGLFALLGFLLLYWRLRQGNKAFMHMAALVEIKNEASSPKSMLEDVMHLVENNQLEVRPSPPPPPPLNSYDPGDEIDELESLKQSWESLIAEQEADK